MEACSALNPMDKPENFEMVGGIGVFRPTDTVTLQEAVQLVTSAIAFAREQHVRKLLVVTSGFAPLKAPTVAERYVIFHEWARVAGPDLCLALVSRSVMRDPQKFVATVAANVGFVADEFASEEEALAWLKSRK